MRVALLIAGYLRTFKHNIDNLKEHILDVFPGVDIYVHLTKNEDSEDKYYNNVNIEEDIKFINTELNPRALLVEANQNFWPDEKDRTTLYNQWAKFSKLNTLKQMNERINRVEYDMVIKYRPDLNFISSDIFPQDLSTLSLHIPQDSKIDRLKLRSTDDNYICDAFAYGTSATMDQYFALYDNLGPLVKKYGTVSETLLAEYLSQEKIDYKLIDINYRILLSSCNIFAIAGDSGSGKSTLGKLLKTCFNNSFMLECDRYHKWERGDHNWKTYTHLNPEANFLEKMVDDIFDLKVGKQIYHVDYDHKTGKFTDQEIIDPSDNIIICGLHSLYTHQDNPYNLKIFIDTDTTLKTKWKIKRDVLERGHPLENVLLQIEKRRDDYERFILPQRENSDLIINFFTDEDLNLDDLNTQDNIKLRLLIDKKYNINKALKYLMTYVPIKVKAIRGFNEIIISEYKPTPRYKNLPQIGDFYDYILYFIFSIIVDDEN